MSVDWADAHEICWRCGCKRKLQKCHIIPYSLAGKDEPSNLVLLCERCHIDAPNVNSKTFIWDWIRSNATPFYDTFWFERAQKEYEFIYKKNYIDELLDRGLLTPRDYEQYERIPIRKSTTHFAHPWKNDSTMAGVLRMQLEDYDKKYANKKPKSLLTIYKEMKFEGLVNKVCKIAKEFNWNVWEGRTKNPFSLTVSVWLNKNKHKTISIKLCRGNVYKACLDEEFVPNPNNSKASDYTVELGDDESVVEEFVKNGIEEFSKLYGIPKKRWFAHTINPRYRLSRGEE